MGKTSVMLPAGRANFRRVVRDQNGKALLDKGGNERVLLFSPGQAVELTEEELEAVRDDIGTTLYIAKEVDKDKPVARPDGEASRKFAEETKKLRAEQQAKRDAEKPAVPPATTRAPAPGPLAKGIEAKGK